MRVRQPNNSQVHGNACQAKDKRPPIAYLCADVRPSLQLNKVDRTRSFQPTGNKNKRARTTDGEPPLKSEIVLRGRRRLRSFKSELFDDGKV
jgi:hypothetical protein